MAFNIKRKDSFDYQTPQEMYQDNKMKKIHGLLDYQAAMIDEYMRNITKRNIALELPTGSGKTLIGLLIGEYRRKKNKESVVYLCPTKQLVNQVVEQAQLKFGIKATAFIGSQKDYSEKAKTDFVLGETIAVTTYSALFTQQFFSDVDIAILDDVHSSEEYIVANWTIKITRDNNIFESLASILRNVLSESNYERLISREQNESDKNGWCELIPMTCIDQYMEQIYYCIKAGVDENISNYYAWKRIGENLADCNFFISNGIILIRPWIAPTMTHEAYAKIKQRILMSATLGKSGELERITGLNNITRLPIVNDWDKRGLGRRFFILPNLSLGDDYEGEVYVELHKNTGKRSVTLSPDDVSAKAIKQFVEENMPETSVYLAKEIESTKTLFSAERDAIITMANRFDGIDFADEESRMLFIFNLPKVVNVQESFLMTKMGSAVLYNERIRTRIIQAVGRCTRNPSDYAVVCIFGDSIRNDLIKDEKLSLFPPELRAELQFGVEQSRKYEKIDQMLIQVQDFLNRTSEWEEAEEYIVELRNEFLTQNNTSMIQIYEKLGIVADFEIQYQYAIWKKDYIGAFSHALEIISKLDAPSLRGYKCFWQYMAGSLACRLYKRGNSIYKQKSMELYKDALKANIKVQWIMELIHQIEIKENFIQDYYVDSIINNFENNLSDNSLPQKFTKMTDIILSKLKSNDGTEFEIGHRNLGTLLGYESYDSSASAAPDPYWIVNSKLCIVSEDKIYETEKHKIPVKHVREALTHEIWLRKNEKRIDKDCKIITVFVTNSKYIEEDAKIFAENILYLNSLDLLKFAEKVVTFVSRMKNTFIDVGDYEWQQVAIQGMIDEHLTPKDFIELIYKKKLNEL